MSHGPRPSSPALLLFSNSCTVAGSVVDAGATTCSAKHSDDAALPTTARSSDSDVDAPGHTVHVPLPPLLNHPDGHVDAVRLVEPAAHAYPAAQLPLHVSSTASDALPNRPAGHGRHAPAPPNAYWPATHGTAVPLVEPSGHAYPALHAPEHDDEVRPETAPNRPLGHGPLHDAVAVTAVVPYRPAAHAEQFPAPAREYCPGGHGSDVPFVDPLGQAYPAVQAPLHVGDVSPVAEP